MPSLACQNIATQNAASRMAFHGRAMIARTDSTSPPAMPASVHTSHGTSSINATAVTRWYQKCEVPVLPEPRPRARASGVRRSVMSVASQRQEPDRGGQHDGERPHGVTGLVDRRNVEAAPGIPQQVPDAVEEVVDQREREAEDEH